MVVNMQNQNDKRLTNPVGKEDQELKIDFGTIVFMIVGAIISWINMLMILYYLQGNFESIFVILAFLSVIFTTSIPGIVIGIKNRFWGYGYILGFAIAGIPFSFLRPPYGDLFIGWYTFATVIFIFIIIWLIFWKTWRSLSLIKSENM